MTPQTAISMLDRQLAAHGQDVRLQSLTGTQLIPFEIDVRAFVRGYEADELVGGITQQDARVIFSPTEIDGSSWPGPNSSATPTDQDRRIPRKGSKAIIAGKVRNVEVAVGLYLDGVLVRIEMRVLG